MRPSSSIYTIDGRDFSTLEEFFDTVGDTLIPGVEWGRNLDAFNDILRGGFGTPDDGFVLRWLHADVSRKHLEYDETIRQLERRLERCHPSNREAVFNKLEAARRGAGPTVFDWLVEIIEDHGRDGTEREDNVVLELIDGGA